MLKATGFCRMLIMIVNVLDLFIKTACHAQPQEPSSLPNFNAIFLTAFLHLKQKYLLYSPAFSTVKKDQWTQSELSLQAHNQGLISCWSLAELLHMICQCCLFWNNTVICSRNGLTAVESSPLTQQQLMQKKITAICKFFHLFPAADSASVS